MSILSGIKAVFLKESKVELRNRTSAFSVFLFAFTAVIIISYAISSADMSVNSFAGMVWVIIFFASMIGQSKVFVGEEERNTILLLKIYSDNTSIYFGKLIYNILFGLVSNFLTAFILLIFNSTINIESMSHFWLVIFCGTIGISASSTIISAIISKASSKNALFPVLTFPVLLPIILLSVDSTIYSINGTEPDRIYSDLGVIIGYSGVLITASYLLFDFVIRD